MAEELPPGAAPVRIGVIGDVHACDEALARLLAYLSADERLDVLCCVGDIVNGPGDPDRCSALLRAASAVTVLGNHGRWLLEGVRLFEDAHRIKGHRHRHAIWRIRAMTLVDAGALLVSEAPCAVVVDVDAATITPLQVAGGAVVALTPHPLRN